MKRYTKPIHLPEIVRRRKADSSLALINVAFLLLLFLIVAGTLRPSLPDDFQWAQTAAETGAASIQGTLVLDQDGSVFLDGQRLEGAGRQTRLENLSALTDEVVIQVDRRTRMGALSSLAAELRSLGVRKVSLITVEAEDQ